MKPFSVSLLPLVAPDAVSSDESDVDSDGDPFFTTPKPIWRSEKYNTLIIETEKKMKEGRRVTGRGAGAGSRKRVRVGAKELLSDRGAPKFLPQDCYDVDWFDTLSVGEVLALQAKKGDQLTIFEKVLNGEEVGERSNDEGDE